MQIVRGETPDIQRLAELEHLTCSILGLRLGQSLWRNTRHLKAGLKFLTIKVIWKQSRYVWSKHSLHFLNVQLCKYLISNHSFNPSFQKANRQSGSARFLEDETKAMKNMQRRYYDTSPRATPRASPLPSPRNPPPGPGPNDRPRSLQMQKMEADTGRRNSYNNVGRRPSRYDDTNLWICDFYETGRGFWKKMITIV